MKWGRPLDLLEAAYRLDGTDAEWLVGLVQAARTAFPEEDLTRTGACVRGKVDAGGQTVVERFEHAYAEGQSILQPATFWDEAIRRLPPAELHGPLYFSAPLASTVSQVVGGRLSDLEFWSGNPAWDSSQVKDALGLTFQDGALKAGVVSVGLRETTTLTPGVRRFAERIAIHIGAAFRLRSSRAATPDRADAVFTPDGKIHHAEVEADRPVLEAGFGAWHHARRGDVRPEAALEIWQGLHDGRWSIVDHIDTDGKAFVLAVRNQPANDVPSGLTDRQRAAVALAALGYRNKQIAYALGLTAAAVAMLLVRARDAAGVRTRTELVRAFKRNLVA
jgi:DNA-binding CsgD family transcriptional regulator